MKEMCILNETKIENMIYEIRGQQVMLDSDLAILYNVEVKRINESVKNNLAKFPERFSWKLTNDEWNTLRSKKSTLENQTVGQGKHRKYLPRVFTEQGVAMLATILKSKQAAQVSIQIMDAFVYMRKYISTNLLEQKYINSLVIQHDEKINILEKTFSKFEEKKTINEMFFDGQIYDAYSKLVDIMNQAKQKLIIIDAYGDKSVLDMLTNIDVPTTLIVKTKGLLKKIDIEKYFKQYDNLTIIEDDSFHDRYILLDDKTMYHCGASLNHAGNKTFSINILEEKEVIECLLSKIKNINNRNGEN